MFPLAADGSLEVAWVRRPLVITRPTAPRAAPPRG